MDSAEFHAAVYHVVRQIPHQKVTSYGTTIPGLEVLSCILHWCLTLNDLIGHVAKLIGMPRNARHVGQALKFLSPDTNPPVPWQRVVSSNGTISSRGPGTQGAQRQREALEAEGVEVTVGRTGDLRVNLAQWGWFPEIGSVDIGVHVAEPEEEDDEVE